MKNISLEVREDGIGVATLNMPGRPLNVFSEHMMDNLEYVIDVAARELKGLVIRSGKNTFVAGADLVMIKDFANMRFDSDWQTMRDRFSHLGKLFRKLELLPIPVVAAVNGLALGGGLELAMACHARVCVDTPAPILGLPEIILALLPGAGGTQRLPRYIGLKPAMKMLLDGKPVTPAYGLEMGLVDEVVAEDELVERAIALVKTIEPKAPWDKDGWQLPETDQSLLDGNWEDLCLDVGGWANRPHDLYPAVKAIMDCVGKGASLPIDQGFDVEWDIFVDLMSDPVAANMVVTCFLNKTAAPKWATSYMAPNAARLESLHWASEVDMPKSVARKASFLPAEDAGVVVADPGKGDSSDSIELCNGSRGDKASEKTASITFLGSLKAAEAVEVYASEELSACTIDLAMAMGKIPVWKISEQGGLNLILETARHAVAKKGYSVEDIAKAGKAIDAEALCSLAGISPVDAEVTAKDRELGLNLLATMALEIRSHCEDRYEEADVLAVLGAGWPRWTGGPIAFLAMLQRNEVAGFDMADAVSVGLAAIDHDLKIKASYNVTAASHGHL